MDKYLLTIITVIISSVIFIMYHRISTKLSALNKANIKKDKSSEDSDSDKYDRVGKMDSKGELSHLKSDDFTLLN